MSDVLKSLVRTAESEGQVELLAPSVGIWRRSVEVGDLLQPGSSLGVIVVLGVVRPLVVPGGARGAVVEVVPGSAREHPVGYSEALVTVDPDALGEERSAGDGAASAQAHQGEVFTAPMSGRFYLRPAPDQPPFVAVGDTVASGQTVCLLEVMKSFNRVTYGGAGLPEQARVVRVAVENGDDVDEGQVLLELGPVSGSA